MIYTLINK